LIGCPVCLNTAVDPQAVAYSFRRLAYNLYGWLASLSRGLGLYWWLTAAYGG